VLGAGVVALAVLVIAGGLVLLSSGPSLGTDANALARVGMPMGGGKIQSVTVVTGPHARRIPVEIRGQQIWPKGLIPAHELLKIDVVVKRPGWISWLSGSTDRLHLTMMTPSASLQAHYLTLAPGAPLRLHFKQPVEVVSYGPPGQLRRHVLASPQTELTLDRLAEAGTISVAAAPRTWETSSPSLVSWFPTGSAASAVASPAPGTQILPDTPITLTFSKTVDAALGSSRPPVSPATPGIWHTVNSHTIIFKPEQYGYGLGSNVNVALPSGVRLVGGQQGGASNVGNWSVPAGSITRAQQLLAMLNYLPLGFNYAGSGVALTPLAQEAAAIKPPAGSFSWRYPNVPSALRNFWQPGASGVVTRGALMAFENDHGLTADGVAGAAVWRALISAVLTGHRSSFGYTFVSVNMSSPETLSLWHNGHTVMTTPVNTGIPASPTAPGTYPVYEHISSGTMSGTNPDGSHYNDTGIPWISYFNGGDALHGFLRGSYGSPQSLGCVEMPYDTAGKVWPYTPIGTLVNVT
jgi:hypothetical protein